MNEAALPYGLALAAGTVSLFGGWLTLRLREQSGVVLGVCAGFLVGVALLDMLPDALRLSAPAPRLLVAACVVAGGMVLLAIGRALPAVRAGRRITPHVGPASLTLHSFTEGIGIGLGFRLSPEIGWTIAAATLAHDLADGINVASLGMATGRRDMARAWLAANGLAPLAGVAVARLVAIAPTGLALLVALLVGVFLVIAATELLPRSVRLLGAGRASVAFLAGLLAVVAWARLGP